MPRRSDDSAHCCAVILAILFPPLGKKVLIVFKITKINVFKNRRFDDGRLWM